jgi:hypothetical protein
MVRMSGQVLWHLYEYLEILADSMISTAHTPLTLFLAILSGLFVCIVIYSLCVLLVYTTH